jgi:hypothetical protein
MGCLRCDALARHASFARYEVRNSKAFFSDSENHRRCRLHSIDALLEVLASAAR